MKKIFLMVATIGLVMASCTQNETDGFNSQNPDVVKFGAATSRASIANLSTLENDADGFSVYAIANGATDWYSGIDGSTNYRYSSGSWGWPGTPPKWPTTSSSYPMTFYAVYPPRGTYIAMVVSSDPAIPEIKAGVGIQKDVSAQKDILVAKATAGAKPTGGILPLTFQHILSKVDLGIIAGYSTKVNVQKIGIMNVKDSGEYNFESGWSNLSGKSSYEYFKDYATNFTTAGSSEAEDTAVPFYAGNHSYHQMLMPQTTSAWDKTAAGLSTGAYIEVFYRIKNGDGDYIGYREATKYAEDHPGYIDGTYKWGDPMYSGITGGSLPYGNRPFYVRVGFPLEVNWVPGKGYTYNICLGTADSTNGYYVDDSYYDEDGFYTGVPIIGADGNPVEKGDPVMDGTINFLVKVTEWDDQAATAVQ